MVPISVERASLLVVAICEADEDPHKDDGTPASKAMVTLEEAVEEQLLTASCMR